MIEYFEEPSPTSTRNKVIVGVIVFLLLAGVAGVLIWYFLAGPGKSDTNMDPDTNTNMDPDIITDTTPRDPSLSAHPLYSCQGCFDYCTEIKNSDKTLQQADEICKRCNGDGVFFGDTKTTFGCYDGPSPGRVAKRICLCKQFTTTDRVFEGMQWQYWENGANNPDPNAPLDHYNGETELIDGPLVTPAVCQSASNTNPVVSPCHRTGAGI